VLSLTHYSRRITCVDTWQGGPDLQGDLLLGLHERFLHNISPWKDKVRVVTGESGVVLKSEEVMSQRYSFIYIDAGICHLFDTVHHSLTHSLTLSPTHVIIHSLTHSRYHPLTLSLTHVITHSRYHSLTLSLIHSLSAYMCVCVCVCVCVLQR
jgi:glucose-6-phosphate-specific signal transduction histidine kinase